MKHGEHQSTPLIVLELHFEELLCQGMQEVRRLGYPSNDAPKMLLCTFPFAL